MYAGTFVISSDSGIIFEMMAERGLELAYTTIMRWVQWYVPEFEKSWARSWPEFRAKLSSQRIAVQGLKHYAYTLSQGVANRLGNNEKNCK